MSDAAATRTGLWAGVGAYGLWGVLALYWRLLDHVDPFEILVHRILWCCVFALVLVRLRGSMPALMSVLTDSRARWAVLAATALIAANWFLFIWAVAARRVTEVSLGYYINPILNVALGAVVLKEPLDRPKKLAVALATLGVAAFTWGLGYLPWLSLVLAGSFGFYGLVRKLAPAGPVVGLALETSVLAPVAMFFLFAVFEPSGGALRTGDAWTRALLILGGPLTALPLLLFATAARRLRYGTLGMLQYIAPTLQLACAVLAFSEPFTLRHLVTFGLVWAGVFLFAWSSRPRPTRESR